MNRRALLIILGAVLLAFVCDLRFRIVSKFIEEFGARSDDNPSNWPRGSWISYDLRYFASTDAEQREIIVSFSAGRSEFLKFWDVPTGSRLPSAQSFRFASFYKPDRIELRRLSEELFRLGLLELSSDPGIEGIREVESIEMEIQGKTRRWRFHSVDGSIARLMIRERLNRYFLSQMANREKDAHRWISEGDDIEPVDVSIAELRNRGNEFDGKRIRVTGIPMVGHEYPALYSGDDDAMNSSISINRPSHFANPEDLQVKCCSEATMVGVYFHGGSGLPRRIGMLDRITQITPTDPTGATTWNLTTVCRLLNAATASQTR